MRMTTEKAPPTRTSASTLVTVSVRGASQCRMLVGSVQAAKIASRGALITRRTRTRALSSSAMGFPFPHLAGGMRQQKRLESIEALAPEPPHRLDPLRGVLEGRA